jgi:hypothetical protein
MGSQKEGQSERGAILGRTRVTEHQLDEIWVARRYQLE